MLDASLTFEDHPLKSYPDVTYLQGLALRAGSIIKQNFCLGMVRQTKDDDTPLTVTDTEINQLVVDSIRNDYPHVRVIGEEGNYDVEEAEYTVLCDPVDGTIPFCRGTPISTFVISVMKEHQPLAAMIYDPFMDRLWHATHGSGAFLMTNGGMSTRRILVSTHNTLRRSNICMVWWKGSPFNLHAAAQKLMDAGSTWGNPLTIAYYGGLLASGEQDATIFPGLKGWETAAMQLIAEEAGGKATDIHGDTLRYGPQGEIEGHIISNGLIHDELVELVASCQ
ncbi:MAG: inositol monophosphatase [Patescibacteria group bacterium]